LWIGDAVDPRVLRVEFALQQETFTAERATDCSVGCKWFHILKTEVLV
jgi:hypothetical protein